MTPLMRGCLNITRCLATASPTAVLTPAVASALQSLLSDTGRALARFDSLSARPIPARRHASDNASCRAPPATCRTCPSGSWHRSARWPASARCCADDRRSFIWLALERNCRGRRFTHNRHCGPPCIGESGRCRRSFVGRGLAWGLRHVAHDRLSALADRHMYATRRRGLT